MEICYQVRCPPTIIYWLAQMSGEEKIWYEGKERHSYQRAWGGHPGRTERTEFAAKHKVYLFLEAAIETGTVPAPDCESEVV